MSKIRVALLSALRNLPVGSRFNITVFWEGFESCFDERSVPLEEASQKRALSWLNNALFQQKDAAPRDRIQQQDGVLANFNPLAATLFQPRHVSVKATEIYLISRGMQYEEQKPMLELLT